jgi:hypothetical protein
MMQKLQKFYCRLSASRYMLPLVSKLLMKLYLTSITHSQTALINMNEVLFCELTDWN